MANTKSGFLRPNIDFSDDEDGAPKPKFVRKISNQIKKTQTNLDAIKTPNTVNNEEDEEEDEVVISDDESPKKTSSRKRKSELGSNGKSKFNKKSKKSESDDEFLPEDDNGDSGSDDGNESDVASEDLSEEENISDSDFNPNSEDEQDEQKEEQDFQEYEEQTGESTINLSSDDGESPEKKKSKTYDPNSEEFWSRVDELRSKGISIQQQSKNSENIKGKTSVVPGRNVPQSPIRLKGSAQQNNSRFTAFSNLCTNFDHDRRCIKKCFLMEQHKQTFSEISNPNLLTPELIKGCIKIVNCNSRLGEIQSAKEAVEMTSNLGTIPGVSALCQAMISGVQAQIENINKLEQLELEGMEALKSKQFTKGLEILDKALAISGSCLRIKMARGDCLAHLGRYVDGAKAASSILQQDQRSTGALFLRGFCLYHKNNLDRALTHFGQVIQINKDHERAKTLLNKVRAFREKKEQAAKAFKEEHLEVAENLLTEALNIDPKNKGVNSNILAERAEVYISMKQFELSVADCEAALKLDQSCMAAMLARSKCHMEQEEWEQAVRIMERMNSRDRNNQQAKVKSAEAARTANNYQEAWRLYKEAVDVDKHNQKYRHLLREAKQKLLLETRVDYYGVLGIEKTVGESEIRKAYFKKSKEYHPDKHANDSDEVKEEFSKKFKHAKEAYEVLSDNDKRKMYDSGRVKAPPGGWYQDVDQKTFESVQMRGGMVRGRGIIRGVLRSPMMRGGMVRGPVMVRGGVRPPIRVTMRPGARPRPVNVRQPVAARTVLRPGMRPAVNGRPMMARPRHPMVNRPLLRGNSIRPNGVPRPRLAGISITPINTSSGQEEVILP